MRELTSRWARRVRQASAAAIVPILVGSAALAATTPSSNGLGDVTGNLTNTGKAAYGTTNAPTPLPTLVGNFINAALGIIGVIMVVLVIYAGFLWMTAAGNDEKVKKAKGILTSAIIGLVIVMAAYSITSFVITSVLKGSGVAVTP